MRIIKIKKISSDRKCREFLKKTIWSIRKESVRVHSVYTDNLLEVMVVRRKCDEQNFIDC